MLKMIVAFFTLLTFTSSAFAVGMTIATALVTAGYLTATYVAVVAFAINMVASAIISKAFFSPNQPSGAFGSGASSDSFAGNRQQIPPATNNKLPIVYGEAWIGGTIVDLSISQNNQELYYVLALSEVTDNGADDITFGTAYWGGKRVTFQVDGHTVESLVDDSTGIVDNTVAGRLQFFFYRNGSFTPTNSTQSAISVMQSSGLTYTWDNSKTMTNTAFVIVHLTYSQTANIRGIEQTRFQITNSRTNTGDVFYDYLTNSVYGGAIPVNQINTNSLNELTVYSNQSFTYTNFSGGVNIQPRFKFNGVIDTNRSIMDNLQDMASCCDCLIKYNEITAQWGVIVQKPTYTVAMNINDSNMVSAISISPIDLAGSYNVIECKFPDNSVQDTFNTANFDLAEIAPELLFPNEPVNKMSISLPLVNNDVQAQYISNRLLKSAREDLQVQLNINYVGIQLEAGDIVTVTSINYGWSDKLFRINKIIEQFGDDGTVIAKLTLSEFNSAVYDDVSITQFTPAPNTGIGDPTFFGTLIAPTIIAEYPTAVNPLFSVQATTSSSGITQYAEIWYSAFSNPTSEQRIFAGTTEIQSSGNPYNINTVMPAVSLVNIPSGNWYFFSRMVNSLASSSFSPASLVFLWRPSTFQYTERYLAVAYADDINGGGFSFEPTNKEYYGLSNQDNVSPPSTASSYTWYFADPNFGTSFYLVYSNRTGRKFSFDSGTAVIAGGNGAFVPSNTLLFDPSTWSALPLGTNIIDLNRRTGQLTETGTTSVGDGSGELAITNNPDGKIVAQLKPYLDFGGSPTFTGAVANLTVDIYGRVVGFEAPDEFFITKQSFTATSGQTAFTVTRASGYITDQCFVFQNGCLLDESEYTDSLTTVTLGTGAVSGDIITVISFKSENASTGVYPSFTRNTVDLTSVSSYTASGFTLVSGYEFIFINGTVLNELDYNITDQTIADFPSNLTGKMTVIQWTPDNLNQPNGFPNNIVAFTVIGQTIYSYSYDVNAFNLYSNGVILLQGTDYTTASGNFTLANIPDTTSTVMVQQTFARTGAV
jgi:membrane protein implicated in regulation of membrane protease activity